MCQNTLSLDYGWFRGMYPKGYCRFWPSCSQYAYESIERYGVLSGGWMALHRLSKCHPYHPGGIDLVKKQQ